MNFKLIAVLAINFMIWAIILAILLSCTTVIVQIGDSNTTSDDDALEVKREVSKEVDVKKPILQRN